MSSITHHRDKKTGALYRYSVESYWDKEKKAPRNKQVYLGKVDPETGELRRTWAFVFTLSWSRHQYVEFVFDQKVETWLRLHRNAFAFFGGVPKRVVIDNLKAGIARVCWHEPQAQQSYRECAEHYDFLIDPCLPRKPEHKGKVEQGGVHYVKRNFLGGNHHHSGQPRCAALGAHRCRAARARHHQGEAPGALRDRT